MSFISKTDSVKELGQKDLFYTATSAFLLVVEIYSVSVKGIKDKIWTLLDNFKNH